MDSLVCRWFESIRSAKKAMPSFFLHISTFDLTESRCAVSATALTKSRCALRSSITRDLFKGD